jgi:hypothetical protein
MPRNPQDSGILEAMLPLRTLKFLLSSGFIRNIRNIRARVRARAASVLSVRLWFYPYASYVRPTYTLRTCPIRPLY